MQIQPRLLLHRIHRLTRALADPRRTPRAIYVKSGGWAALPKIAIRGPHLD